MCIYTLYIKTHKKTGLKYLGQTKQNPLKYRGSGTVWNTHIKKYGMAHHTEILLQTTNWEELKYYGRYYSTYYNIVNAQDDFGNKIWANKIPETGGGGTIGTWDNPEWKQQRLEQIRHSSSMIDRISMSHNVKISLADPEIKQRHQTGCKNAQNDSSIRNQNSKTQKKTWADSVNKNARLLTFRRDKNHQRYDHTTYTFYHKSGIIEICTRNELIKKYNLHTGAMTYLIKNKIHYHKGWMLTPFVK